MTENEYRTLPRAQVLPLYHDIDDSGCDSILRYHEAGFDGTVHEAVELEDAFQCLANPSLVFKGGIRYTTDEGEPFVHAYFWHRLSAAQTRTCD